MHVRETKQKTTREACTLGRLRRSKRAPRPAELKRAAKAEGPTRPLSRAVTPSGPSRRHPSVTLEW